MTSLEEPSDLKNSELITDAKDKDPKYNKEPNDTKEPNDKDLKDLKDPKDHIVKLVVCGDGASGKTSLCSRFALEAFDKNYNQTLGLDFFSRRLLLPGDVSVTVHVWDVGGQSIASAMLNKYFFDANAVLFVYDITNTASFDNVSEWIDAVKKLLKTTDKWPVMFLIGNKTDLEFRRTVKVEKHTVLAAQHSIEPHYTSAKTADAVLLVFRMAVAAVLNIQLSKQDIENDIVPMAAEASATIDAPRRANASTVVCSIM